MGGTTKTHSDYYYEGEAAFEANRDLDPWFCNPYKPTIDDYAIFEFAKGWRNAEEKYILETLKVQEFIDKFNKLCEDNNLDCGSQDGSPLLIEIDDNGKYRTISF